MAFYLSLSVMYKRAKLAQADLAYYYGNDFQKKLPQPLVQAYEVYQISTQQYLGFGGLLQYVPGTQANKARKQLIDELEPTITELKKKLAIAPESKSDIIYHGLFFIRHGWQHCLSSYFNFSFLFFFAHTVINEFTHASGHFFPTLENIIGAFPLFNGTINYLYNKYNKTRLDESRPIFIKFLLQHLQESKLYSHLFYDLLYFILNPAVFLKNTIQLFYFSTIFLLNNTLPEILRDPIKGFLGLCAAIVTLPINFILYVCTVSTQIVELMIINPLIHTVESAFKAYKHQGKDLLLATVKELQDIKELRRTAKGQENTSYTVIQSATGNTKYIGITKSKLYTENINNPERLVAIRASAEKIIQSSQLLTIFKTAETKEQAVEQAEACLGLIIN